MLKVSIKDFSLLALDVYEYRRIQTPLNKILNTVLTGIRITITPVMVEEFFDLFKNML